LHGTFRAKAFRARVEDGGNGMDGGKGKDDK
jgi:hypothetical protein